MYFKVLNIFSSFKACNWDFDDEAFRNVSEEGKDFIRKLLVKQKEKRMNVHECLQHPWLTGDHSHKDLEIARTRYKTPSWNPEFGFQELKTFEYFCYKYVTRSKPNG